MAKGLFVRLRSLCEVEGLFVGGEGKHEARCSMLFATTCSLLPSHLAERSMAWQIGAKYMLLSLHAPFCQATGCTSPTDEAPLVPQSALRNLLSSSSSDLTLAPSLGFRVWGLRLI